MDIKKLMTAEPLVSQMADYKEILWFNPKLNQNNLAPFTTKDIQEAEARLSRFAPYLAKAFPETAKTEGIIESKLIEIPKMKIYLDQKFGKIPGKLYLKCDSHLPVSGSIKARGGIYEVLKFAEEIAVKEGLITEHSDYSALLEEPCRQLFQNYSVAVGSTGNLGLSIGMISAKLGFHVTVHMSADARRWKKDLLREKGVTVVEYPDDYQKAVAQGRKEAAADPRCHFVDDENSKDLFLGYAVAGRRLQKQLEAANIAVDPTHPLFVYIPCGVGGAPGGVAFGLKEIYGDNVHIFFAEPTHAPCMTLSLISGFGSSICVADIGLDGLTAADGLAVGRASGLVSSIMETRIDGCFTIDDEKLYPFLARLADKEQIYIEPSACACFPGPGLIAESSEWLNAAKLKENMENATHILWATGGSMVPDEEMHLYYERGK